MPEAEIKVTHDRQSNELIITVQRKGYDSEKKNLKARILATDKFFENKIVDGERGFEISVKFETFELKNVPCVVAVCFWDRDKKPLPDMDGEARNINGQVAVSKKVIPGHTEAVFNDCRVFIPNDQLHLEKRKRHDLFYQVAIFGGGELIAQSELEPFHITP